MIARGRITGVEVRDRLSAATWGIRARMVLNAAGPFVDAVRGLDEPAARPLLRVSAGCHVVLGSRFPAPDTGFLIPAPRMGG